MPHALLQTEVEDLDVRSAQQRKQRPVQEGQMLRVNRDGDALQHQRVESQNLIDALGGSLALDVVLERESERAFDGLSQVGVVGIEAEDGLLHLLAFARVSRVEVVGEALEEGGRQRVEEGRGELLEQRDQQLVDALEERPGGVQKGNGDVVGVELRLRWEKRGKATSGVG